MRWMIGIAVLLASPALAQDKTVAKADKMVAKYEQGKTTALAKAWSLLGKAKEHPDTRDDAGVWVRIGDVARTYAENPELESPIPDPWDAALTAYRAAGSNNADAAQTEALLEGALIIESMRNNAAVNAFESGDHKEAWSLLEYVLTAQTLVRQNGKLEPQREIAAHKLALLTAVELGKLDEAQLQHNALGALKALKTGTTLALCRAIEEARGDEFALNFLVPFADAAPKDGAFFAERLRLLRELDRTDAIRELLIANADQLGRAPKVTARIAQEWLTLEDWNRAELAYAKAYELDPSNPLVLRNYASLRWRRTLALEAKAEKTRSSRKRRAVRKQRDTMREAVIGLLEASEEAGPDDAVPTLELLLTVLKEWDVDDPEEIAAVESRLETARGTAKP